MSIYPYKKTNEKEKKSPFNCIFCGRQLTHSEIFFFGNHCIIDRLKFNIQEKDAEINKYKSAKK